jgi:hypothetical protein
VTQVRFNPEQIERALSGLTPTEREELDLILQFQAKPKVPPPDVLTAAFPEQKQYILDPAPLKFLFCTRRAAKSFSFGLECFHDSKQWPKGNYLFLGLVREEAKRIFWKDVLKEIDAKFGLKANFNESSLTCTLPNGATIYIGAADANDQEWRKLLGQKYRKIFIDEAQDWKLDLKELVYSTLKPATTDHKGSITLAGTPGRTRVGLFWDLTRNSKAGLLKPTGQGGWSGHSWTTFSNLSVMPSGDTMSTLWANQIEELKATHPRIEETPAFRRNFLGEWVIEDDALVYRYNPAKNDWNGKLPQYERGRWHYVLGVDLGYNDDSSFVKQAYHDFDPNLYIVSAFKQKGMDISAVAARIKTYPEVDIVVIDGSNKQAVMEMQNRHGLSLYPADKTGKPDFIELMNAEFIMERIKVNVETCGPLIEEWQGLVWNDKTTKREEHPACPNHACDAGLYGWRYSYQYISKPLPPVIEQGSKEYYDAEVKKMLERTMQEMENVKRGEESNAFGPVDNASDWGMG